MQFNEALEILNLKSGYTEQELRTNYRALVKKWHPDLNPSPDAAKMTQKLNEAQTVLMQNMSKSVNGQVKNDIMSYRHKTFFDIMCMRSHSNGKIRFKHKSFFDVVLT